MQKSLFGSLCNRCKYIVTQKPAIALKLVQEYTHDGIRHSMLMVILKEETSVMAGKCREGRTPGACLRRACL